ncbi:hypothetical protein MMYC01_203936 [Madurella mycetomatis]|uniref:Uncharacterized protein n=1 Tax=Madurella mycetomatis TaxID=100816 RepID=A0A175WAI9_9PEZI|nr:hypothetical protein MMYC01_203936 [Madurella mycetomatis]
MKTFSLLALAAQAAVAQDAGDLPDTPNPSISLSTCESLGCSPSNNSVCAHDLPGAPVGVGIAPQVLDISTTNLSLTLVDGFEERGFTAGGLPDYEFTDLQLFVGVDPNVADDEYPSGCALMMQYQGQTFPVPDDRDDEDSDLANTTSCEGVVDELCQAAIYNMVRGFNGSSSEEDGEADRCAALTRHINMRLREDNLMCGANWVSSFINVTGGALPGPDMQTADNEALGDQSCRPVLPQSFQLYPVARMRQLYFIDPPESDFLQPLFGGRAGFTPVFTVMYNGEGNDSTPNVRFVCMRTYQANGDPQPDPFEGTAVIARPMNTATVIWGILMIGFAAMMM